MRQYIDIEHYKLLIDNVGIEEAYKMRFRQTGRTVRDVLRITLMLSEGKKVHLANANSTTSSQEMCKYVMRRVYETAGQLGMQVTSVGPDALYYPESGGRMAIINVNSPSVMKGRDHEWEVYNLHDC